MQHLYLEKIIRELGLHQGKVSSSTMLSIVHSIFRKGKSDPTFYATTLQIFEEQKLVFTTQLLYAKYLIQSLISIF